MNKWNIVDQQCIANNDADWTTPWHVSRRQGTGDHIITPSVLHGKLRRALRTNILFILTRSNKHYCFLSISQLVPYCENRKVSRAQCPGPIILLGYFTVLFARTLYRRPFQNLKGRLQSSRAIFIVWLRHFIQNILFL